MNSQAQTASASGTAGQTIVTRDGTHIYYKDWGAGQPVVFSHGWPLHADAWDAQMLFLSERGFRVIAHDRRGHGRSGQPSQGNDMDTYADDLAALLDALDIQGGTLVGHSTGGGEVARYIDRHGSKRVARVVLIGAVPPVMAETASNPDGLLGDLTRNSEGYATARFFSKLPTSLPHTAALSTPTLAGDVHL
ncbi:alpha/beta hydrolase family protein [Achromobacter marplatensis]|uniref:Alpha/beta hydrolase family protein n=1 Tax=Achromobacter marplatensis TaxID=470868 RepID=A0ABX9GB80_9BURK|nr:alpha/beta hydrolase [Achromobacter marplatensis]RBP18984.1 alpha/beta hydrolase family protein [Achromobacter marplatensis]CAB3694394.1 Putative aminoacrylate hydrolase RutD [Achromobacter marplatensis]